MDYVFCVSFCLFEAPDMLLIQPKHNIHSCGILKYHLTGEVAKLFADAGLICIASLISPYRKERDACRAMLSDSSFIEVIAPLW